MKRNLTITLIGFGLMVFFSFQNCDKNPTKPKNQQPMIIILTANPDSLDWGGTSQLVVVAEDPEGQSLSYFWEASDGFFITETDLDTVVWQAPDSSGSCFCTVSVSDGQMEAKKKRHYLGK